MSVVSDSGRDTRYMHVHVCVWGGGGGGGGGDVCMDYRLSARLNFRQDKWCNLNA